MLLLLRPPWLLLGLVLPLLWLVLLLWLDLLLLRRWLLRRLLFLHYRCVFFVFGLLYVDFLTAPYRAE
ncbi:MAG: hypothetical protein M3N18_05755 [Actinomycetota bacterium]|nr:hypothetical protein [Actinomycetota bacterium]